MHTVLSYTYRGEAHELLSLDVDELLSDLRFLCCSARLHLHIVREGESERERERERESE